MTRTLILTVGLPRSGKTTWARQQGFPMVSPDAIRYALHGQRYAQVAEPFVWAMAKAMVSALFIAGHETVIVDATNTTVKRRQEWVNPGQWATRYKFIECSVEECLQRAALEEDDDIIPVIHRQAEAFEGPTPMEQDLIWRES